MKTSDGTIWTRIGKSGDYTIWKTATIPSVYQVTKGSKKLTNGAGYYNLGALLRMLGLNLIAEKEFEGYPGIAHDLEKMRQINSELVAALTRLLRAFESDKNVMPNCDVLTCWETNSMAIKQALDALAKAKGE